MSDATSPASRHGYITVPFPYQGTVYNFTFYEGFVGRIVLRPQGGPPVEVYKQEGVYHVPQPKSGEMRGPDERSTITVKGGPSELDIALEIDNGPVVDFKGPIKKVKLRARKEKGRDPAAAHKHGPWVRVLHGEDQVEAIALEMKEGRGVSRGGVQAFQTGGGGGDDIDIENDSKTCPPHCK